MLHGKDNTVHLAVVICGDCAPESHCKYLKLLKMGNVHM
jgi:hypothetical protein